MGRLNTGMIINVNNNGAVSITGTITRFTRVPIVVFPAVTSASTPYATLSIMCGSSNRFSHCLFLPRGPSTIVTSANVVTTTPAGFFTTNVNSTLTAFFRTHTYYCTSNLGLMRGHMSHANLNVTLVYCRLVIRGMRVTVSTTHHRMIAPTLRRVIRTAVCLDNVNTRSNNLTTTRTIDGNVSSLPRLRRVRRNRGMTFNLLARLILRGTSTRRVRGIVCMVGATNLPLALTSFNVRRVIRSR